MTPFGQRMRQLRASHGHNQKQMARAIGVSQAYLSALEHGRRGRPSWYLIQRIISYFNVIWDDAEEIVRLARLSHPRVVIDTAGLSPRATEVANTLAATINTLSQDDLKALHSILNKDRPAASTPATGNPSKPVI